MHVPRLFFYAITAFRLSILGNFKLEVGAYLIGETRINYFARVLFAMLGVGCIIAALCLAHRLSNSRVLVIHRMGAEVINIFHEPNIATASSDSFNNGNCEESDVCRIKTTDDISSLTAFAGYGAMTIISILLLYFSENDLVGIVMSFFFLTKVVSISFIASKHANGKINDEFGLYNFFVKYFISISVCFDDFYANCVQQGYSKPDSQTRKVKIQLKMGDMVSTENKDLFYVSTRPKHSKIDKVFCNPGRSEIHVEGATKNQKSSLLRYLQPGSVADSGFTEWSPSFGIDIWFYLVYQGLQSGKIMQVYEIENISDALGVLIIVGASASLLQRGTDRLFSTKFVKSFESRGFLLKIVNKMNATPNTDEPTFEVKMYFEEADGTIETIICEEKEGVLIFPEEKAIKKPSMDGTGDSSK